MRETLRTLFVTRLPATNVARRTLRRSFVCALLFAFAFGVVPDANAQAVQTRADNSKPAASSQRADTVRRARALARRLDLSPEQTARLREIRRQSAPERRALAENLRQAERALDAAIYADTIGETEVEERISRVAEIQREMTRLRAVTELKIRRLLTPEQLRTLRSLREREREGRDSRRNAAGKRAGRGDAATTPRQ